MRLAHTGAILIVILCAGLAGAMPAQTEWTPVAVTPPGTAGAVRTETVEPPPGTPAQTQHPGKHAPRDCAITIQNQTESIPPLGGKMALQIEFNPPSCRTEPEALANWMFPVHGSFGEGGVYEWTIAPNPSAEPRQATITVGDKQVLVRQQAAPAVRYALAPSRLNFTFREKKRPKPQTIQVWTEDSELTYTISSGVDAWLVVTPEKRKPGDKRQKIRVAIQPDALAPGRYQGMIRIVADTAGARPLAIPVTVEVQPRK